MLELLGRSSSINVRKVLWVCAELDIAYQHVEWGSGEFHLSDPAFLALNPNGLVPVIRDADQLSISGVNGRIRDLSSRAHSGKLRLDELQGGTFTVNNTGWFGSVSSMPIVNAPEVAILSMEAIVKRPRVVDVDGEDVIAIRHMMNMTCSFDHRVLDGAQVGFFLADIRTFLEEWDADTSVG